ncbi:hypothetical protein PIB30_088896 [Stylosanthes scabra]|uniref:Uncharacterized protein n=1 Tax=Stylosanthes scabra TaxID=79078 RepID=A0ABU6TTJ9_9FABA|nr:hypothetical protein [Stylosanthes scabra]
MQLRGTASERQPQETGGEDTAPPTATPKTGARDRFPALQRRLRRNRRRDFVISAPISVGSEGDDAFSVRACDSRVEKESARRKELSKHGVSPGEAPTPKGCCRRRLRSPILPKDSVDRSSAAEGEDVVSDQNADLLPIFLACW